jgi:hypothetical protein
LEAIRKDLAKGWEMFKGPDEPEKVAHDAMTFENLMGTYNMHQSCIFEG